MRKMSAVALSCRSGTIAGRRRDGGDARQAEVGPQQAGRHDAVMRRDDQAVELVVGVVGEREHHPVLAAFAGAHLDAADDAVGSRRGRNLDAVGFAALMVEDGGEVDGRRVTADADRVNGVRRRRDRNNHEAQRNQRKAPDQTQCQYSATNDSSRPSERVGVAAINDMKAKEIKGFPPSLRLRSVKPPTQFCQYVRWSPSAGARRRPFPAGMSCPSAVLRVLRATAASPWPRSPRPSPPYPH